MQKQDIEIIILPDGTIEYVIKGIKGGACENVSALLEQLGQIVREERTGEFYERDEEAHIALGTS
ncbi:MAG: DUF2997 domain-containing protein [Caldilineaceae bacterium]